MDADLPPHPSWCSERRCTAGSAPVNGHATGTHRSAPEASGLTELYLVQMSAAEYPSVEFVRSGRSVLLPLVEALSVGAAMDDLALRGGVGL